MIRPALPGDRDAIARLERRSFDEHAFSRRQISYYQNRNESVVLVFSENPEGRIEGYVIGGVDRRRRPATFLVHSLAVRPDSREKGIGSRLMRAATERARGFGASRMELQVSPRRRAAERLYERLGFHRVNRIPDYYGSGRPANVYRRKI